MRIGTYRFKAAGLGAVAFVALLAGSAQAQMAGTPDADLQAVLTAQQSLGLKPLPTLSVDEAREQPTVADGQKKVLSDQLKSIAPEPVASVDNITIPGDQGEFKARVYTPENPGDQPLPVIVYWHGGGWVVGSLDAYDATPRALANGAHAVVVSCDYHESPEYKFPAAHDDALRCYQWVTQNTDKLKADPYRIAVAGESAGGNMAAEVAIEARDRKMPLPVYQLLVYPVAGGGFDQPSYKANATAKPLDTATVKWMLNNYIVTPADATNPRLAIVDTPDFKGLPPATVITAEIDPLNSEGRAYAKKLIAAGVPVDFRNYQGMTHEFFGLGASVAKAKEAEMLASSDLTRAFAHEAPVKSTEQP